MKKLCTFLIIGVLILIANYPQPKWNEVEVNEFNWQPFEWIPGKLGETQYDKAAIFVPLQFDGSEIEYWLQLDTGTNSNFEGVNIESIDVPFKIVKTSSTYEFVSINAKIAGYNTKNVVFASMKGQGEVLPASEDMVCIGNLGMDFFKDKILVLDFPNNRLAIATSMAQLPDEITDTASFFKGKMSRHLFVINLTLDGSQINVAYDTGSSIFPLVVNQDFWQQITGKEGDETDNIHIEASAHGNSMSLIGAQIQEELFLSDHTLGYPKVYFAVDNFEWFKDAGIDGIMGNEPFYDDYIVILDGIGMRFGLVKMK